LRVRDFAIAVTMCGALCACSHDTVVVPPPPPTPQEILAKASADDFTCTRALAADVTFAKLESTPDAFTDKCVKIKGLATARYLFRDGAAIQAQKSMPQPATTIGIFWKDEAAAKKLDAGAQFVELVGRVRKCDARVALLHNAGILDAESCAGVPIAIFASQSHIYPTAMD
jgi:hypothetical protein